MEFVKKVLKTCSIALTDSDVECLINSLSRILRSVALGMTALFNYNKFKNYSLKLIYKMKMLMLFKNAVLEHLIYKN